MAKAQVAAAAAPARFMTEVAPAPVVPVMRRTKVPWCLDTIAEEDREQLQACGSPSSDLGFAAAWSMKRMPTPPQQPRDLGKYFSDAAHGCQAARGWECGHKLGHQPLHKVGA